MQSQVSVPVVRELLRKMSSPQVKQAEQQMNELAKNKQFVDIISFILTSQQQQQWVKTMAASCLNQQFSSTLNQQNCQPITQALFKILTHLHVKDLDKRIFQKSVIRCLEESTQAQREKWVLLVQQCLQNAAFYDAAFLVIACVAVADIPNKLIQKVITQTFQPILNSIIVKVQTANLTNEMIKMWIVIMDKLCQQKKMRPLLQNMISSPSLFKLINGVYQLHASQNTILCVQKGLDQLNFLKYQAAELHKRMLEIESKQAAEGLSRVLDFTRPYLPIFANTLSTVGSRKNLIQNFSSQDLITSLLAIIRLYIVIKPDQLTLQHAISFQNQIIFPFLAINDDQMHRFQEQPEQFNSLAEDCCDKQTFGILKTQAAKLLECLGDKIQGSLKYTVNRAIESISIKFGNSQGQTFKDLQVLQIQTAFLALSIFSYGLISYPDQTSALCKILSDERAKSLPPLELSRIFTFLAYNYFQVFKDPTSGQGWLNLAISYKAHPTTRYCAFDCFSNIIEEYFDQSFIERIAEEIQTGNIGLVWQIVTKIISQHYSSLSHKAIIILTSKLFLRIQRELTSLNNLQKNDSLDIINSLRTFVVILKEVKGESKQNIERKQFIIAAIWPILDFYDQAKALDIQDEVVKIAIQIVNAMDPLAPEIYKHVAQYVAAFKGPGSNYTDKIYFRFFNQLFTKADFQRDKEEITKVIIVLKDAVLSAITKLSDSKSKKLKPIPHLRLALCNALIVLQNAIAYFGTDIMKLGGATFFQELTSLCIRLLPQTNDEGIQRTPSGHIILSRVLNTLFLCHMHRRVDQIYMYLQILQNQKLYHGYDTKVIAMCTAKQIFQEADVTAIVLLLTAVSKFVELSENKNEALEKNKKTKSNNMKINHQIKKMDDFDKIIAHINSPFKNDKEVTSLLGELLAEMKKGNSEMYSAVLNALPAEVLQYLNVHIDFESQQKKKRVIRKVVGIKMTNEVKSREVIEVQLEKMGQGNDQKMNQGGDQKMNQGSDQEEQDLGFKRTRAKLKMEGKRKKMVKLDYKRDFQEA